MEAPRHLVVLQHGLWASPGTLRGLERHLRAALPGSTRFLSSWVNASALSVRGIQACGERLAREVEAAVEEHPGVQRISFVGHSFGGIICRRAARLGLEKGRGDNDSGAGCRVFGLEPGVFATIASPHLGVAVQPSGGLEVPLLSWVGAALPPRGADFVRTVGRVVGTLVHGQTGWDLLQSLEPAVGGRVGAEDELELLTLVDDAHLAALRAFSRRVLYSAVDLSPGTPTKAIGIDHMVPFRSSSLRTESEAQAALEGWAPKEDGEFGEIKQWGPVRSVDTGGVHTHLAGTPPRTAAQACLARLNSLEFYKVDVVMRGFALLAHRSLVNPGSSGGLALAHHLEKTLDLTVPL